MSTFRYVVTRHTSEIPLSEEYATEAEAEAFRAGYQAATMNVRLDVVAVLQTEEVTR